jgi:tetratricopeptide (TPR) repeat protein
MAASVSSLVEIVREFLVVDEALRHLVARYRDGSLAWDEVRTLVTDQEESPLYRLKERSHALFRAEGADHGSVHHREVLFDLAIGSLFHEAMKFRENFYQREVYGPRVRDLRQDAGAEAAALFAEFEKILELGSERLEESVVETEALLDRCREQLSDLIAQNSRDGHVARHLIERSEAVVRVFERELDALFDELYGSTAAAWALAGRSYVVSGYFAEGGAALSSAIERGAEPAATEPWIAYARGMAAYMRGDYEQSVGELEGWSKTRDGVENALVEQACAAMSRIERLVSGVGRDALVRRADALVAELAP